MGSRGQSSHVATTPRGRRSAASGRSSAIPMDRCPAPSFYPDGGAFGPDTAVQLTVRGSSRGIDILYTTDFSEPVEGEPGTMVYRKPIPLAVFGGGEILIRACAVSKNCLLDGSHTVARAFLVTAESGSAFCAESCSVPSVAPRSPPQDPVNPLASPAPLPQSPLQVFSPRGPEGEQRPPPPLKSALRTPDTLPSVKSPPSPAAVQRTSPGSAPPRDLVTPPAAPTDPSPGRPEPASPALALTAESLAIASAAAERRRAVRSPEDRPLPVPADIRVAAEVGAATAAAALAAAAATAVVTLEEPAELLSLSPPGRSPQRWNTPAAQRSAEVWPLKPLTPSANALVRSQSAPVQGDATDLDPQFLDKIDPYERRLDPKTGEMRTRQEWQHSAQMWEAAEREIPQSNLVECDMCGRTFRDRIRMSLHRKGCRGPHSRSPTRRVHFIAATTRTRSPIVVKKRGETPDGRSIDSGNLGQSGQISPSPPSTSQTSGMTSLNILRQSSNSMHIGRSPHRGRLHVSKHVAACPVCGRDISTRAIETHLRVCEKKFEREEREKRESSRTRTSTPANNTSGRISSTSAPVDSRLARTQSDPVMRKSSSIRRSSETPVAAPRAPDRRYSRSATYGDARSASATQRSPASMLPAPRSRSGGSGSKQQQRRDGSLSARSKEPVSSRGQPPTRRALAAREVLQIESLERERATARDKRDFNRCNRLSQQIDQLRLGCDGGRKVEVGSVHERGSTNSSLMRRPLLTSQRLQMARDEKKRSRTHNTRPQRTPRSCGPPSARGQPSAPPSARGSALGLPPHFRADPPAGVHTPRFLTTPRMTQAPTHHDAVVATASDHPL
eukprot:TRINITY_DN30411_c0_g1_i1.p1 TRINITY_DN30411_c0_g1~~TRINITY_DN30411_c0_g1_i1.p1  ORF type:complete len:843 (+),score=184.50 TRINITY_DN30411_c0_g1_i1:151-2679(+)